MNQLMEDAPVNHDLKDNKPTHPGPTIIQGCYEPNGQLLSHLELTSE
jgi:hypothetical protein